MTTEEEAIFDDAIAAMASCGRKDMQEAFVIGLCAHASLMRLQHRLTPIEERNDMTERFGHKLIARYLEVARGGDARAETA
ncbi:hypothetical protein Msil_2178 [Methylocella silvestris BL2]|uniref:Uncharacterized protein n=1 Tax=Methylocella silvestris (strain DSM 15510 / CIP 108128 / LMG 27833 / NCIMB 13906 / BL2) TaxID=395965 RepID=B8ESX8_METSB|nr:hypothetical protein [Methylocella silvestris]ACK51116.1 hypothetical protein Msil_2178 [Methylocella silvestris BL2]